MTRHHRQRAKRASALGKKMAVARWSQDRKRRAAMAMIAECGFSSAELRIARRIIVIDGEQSVRETVIYETDCDREARRKLKAVLGSPLSHPRPSALSVVHPHPNNPR